MHTSRIAVSVGTALLLAASAGIANATTISSAFLPPTLPAGYTAVNLGSIGVPFNTPISGPGYGVTFAVTDPLQGVVNGAGPLLPHAVPVAGASGSQPLYLTGDFGSGLTSDISQSGNYFSTGIGSITITFDQPQYVLVLLWGSIDVGNFLTFNDVAGSQVTGLQVQQATAGFLINGDQGVGGSAYVTIDTDTPFTSVTASSSVISFEFAGVAASSTPEPNSFWCLFGLGIGIVALRRRISLR
jgi:hypothetical protein